MTRMDVFLRTQLSIVVQCYDDDDDDNNEIAYFSVRWEKLVSSTALNRALKPRSRVETENGLINWESQCGVFIVRDLWWIGYTKKVSLEFTAKEWRGDGWIEKVEKRKMGWDKHEKVKLVHEVKQEVDSRDEARHTEKSDQWFSLFREEAEDGRASVTTSEERVLLSVWREMRLCR